MTQQTFCTFLLSLSHATPGPAELLLRLEAYSVLIQPKAGILLEGRVHQRLEDSSVFGVDDSQPLIFA